MEDTKRREEADRIREEGRKRFAKEVASRVDGLRGAVKSVKGDIMGKGDYWNIRLSDIWVSPRPITDGLTHVFATVKVTPDIRGLPDNYKAVVEWARISSVASSILRLSTYL